MVKMENTSKMNDYKKTLSFCKYLRKESSDFYEILNLSSYDSNELTNQFSRISMHANVRTR